MAVCWSATASPFPKRKLCKSPSGRNATYANEMRPLLLLLASDSFDGIETRKKRRFFFQFFSPKGWDRERERERERELSILFSFVGWSFEVRVPGFEWLSMRLVSVRRAVHCVRFVVRSLVPFIQKRNRDGGEEEEEEEQTVRQLITCKYRARHGAASASSWRPVAMATVVATREREIQTRQ